jgi:hypothetical protein
MPLEINRDFFDVKNFPDFSINPVTMRLWLVFVGRYILTAF